MLTTTQSFPNEDISHRPKRLQSDNLRVARGDDSLAVRDGSEMIKQTNVPQVVTLERAIKYYRDNAVGDYELLFNKTAEWLEVMLSKSIPVTVNVQDLPTSTSDD